MVLKKTGRELSELKHDIVMTRFCDVSILIGNFLTNSVITFFRK